MAYPFEPTPRLPELGQTPEEKGWLILDHTKQLYLKLADANTPNAVEAKHRAISFYLATRWGLQPEDPVLVDDGVVLHYLDKLGGRDLRYMEVRKNGDSYELGVNVAVYDASNIASRTWEGIPKDMEFITLRESDEGLSLGGMQLDLADSLDRVAGDPVQPYIDKLGQIVGLAESATYINK